MELSFIFAVNLVLLMFNFPVAKASTNEQELINYLFEHYKPEVRPVVKDSDAVDVTLGLTISQVIDVDEKNQIFTVSVFMRQVWHNPILAWNNTKFKSIKSINVRPKKLWLPDIVLYNNADSDISFGGNFDRLNTRVILWSNGKNVWLAPAIIKSKCQIDVKDFPFDEQRCKLKFGSWTYDGGRLNLSKEADEADLAKFLPNAEWRLVAVPAVRNEVKYFCCPETYPDVTYTFRIKRRSLFYLTNLIFPMVMMCALTILSFLLPAESGERISLAITLLLAMTVFMLVVADMIPPTSETIPLVGIFFNAAMVEMVLMIVSLCVVIRFYHKQATDPAMPTWVRKYVLDYLSYKLGVRPRIASQNTNQNNQSSIELTYISKGPGKIRLDSASGRSITSSTTSTRRIIPNGIPHRRPEKVPISEQRSITASETSDGLQELDGVTRKLDTIIDKLSQRERDERYRQEWRIVAMTFDKCLLIAFCFVIVLTIFLVFLNSPGYVK